MAKKKHMLRRRTAISMGIHDRDVGVAAVVRRRTDGLAFDDEQEHHGAADDDREVGDPD
jgi:hypothetical protein